MKKILVIRKTDEFSRTLAANDYEVVNLPLIKTRELQNLSDFERKLETLGNYDGIFLTSSKAAEIFLAKLIEKEINYRGKIYVLGKSGFEVLRNKNLNLVFFESANTAREMLDKIAPEELENKNFLFVRGEQSLRVVPDFLSRVASVDEAFVYRTENIAVENDKLNSLREKFGKNEICTACFFSPSAAQSFIEQFGAAILHQTCIAVIGKTTAEFFERRNLSVKFISPQATAKDFAVALVKYLKNKAEICV